MPPPAAFGARVSMGATGADMTRGKWVMAEAGAPGVPLGDPGEASIVTALDFLAGRSCTAIGAAAEGIAESRAAPAKRELVMPQAPSPAQIEIPGLQ